jgi:hypothetical protein
LTAFESEDKAEPVGASPTKSSIRGLIGGSFASWKRKRRLSQTSSAVMGSVEFLVDRLYH